MLPTDAMPMRSRWVALRPPSNQLLDRLYLLASAADVPWDWGGRRETPEGFRESLHADLFVMFAVVDVRTGTEVGLLRACEFHPLHRFTFLSATLLPAYQGRVWPLEAVALFANYLFVRFDLRHIYGRITGDLYPAIRSGAGTYFEVEAQLKEQVVVNSEPQDVFVLTLSREHWMKRGRPLLERIAL